MVMPKSGWLLGFLRALTSPPNLLELSPHLKEPKTDKMPTTTITGLFGLLRKLEAGPAATTGLGLDKGNGGHQEEPGVDKATGTEAPRCPRDNTGAWLKAKLPIWLPGFESQPFHSPGG